MPIQRSRSLFSNQIFLIIVLPICLLIIAAFITPFSQWVIELVKPDKPRFIVLNSITRPDSTLIIEARNSAAESESNLDVEFDNIVLNIQASPIKNSNQLWKINNLDHCLPTRLLNDGPHIIRLGFKGKPLSEPITIYFNTEVPIVNVKIHKEDSTDNIISVKAATKLQIPEDTLKVEVYYFTKGQPQRINLPVKRVVKQESGAFYFEFESQVQGLPKISKSDPQYSMPFFGFKVIDQAGNNYYEVQSYAEFIAPGDKLFGVNKLADIKVTKFPVEGQIQKTVFNITPTLKEKKLKDDGTPAIILKVTDILDYRELIWETKVNDVQPATLIFKNNKNIGTSFSNKFKDASNNHNDHDKYRVERKSVSGDIVYSSNEERPLEARRMGIEDLKGTEPGMEADYSTNVEYCHISSSGRFQLDQVKNCISFDSTNNWGEIVLNLRLKSLVISKGFFSARLDSEKVVHAGILIFDKNTHTVDVSFKFKLDYLEHLPTSVLEGSVYSEDAKSPTKKKVVYKYRIYICGYRRPSGI